MRMTSSSLTASITLALAAGFTVHADARADSVIYKCVDKNGRVEFTDINKSGCKPLDLPGYIPGPAPAPRASAAPASAAAPMRQGADRPNAAANPNGFPRVDNATQRARDNDRRDILNDELSAEARKLADLKTTFNDGQPERQGNEKNYAKYQERVAQLRDDIARSEKNIEALKRELANIR